MYLCPVPSHRGVSYELHDNGCYPLTTTCPFLVYRCVSPVNVGVLPGPDLSSYSSRLVLVDSGLGTPHRSMSCSDRVPIGDPMATPNRW